MDQATRIILQKAGISAALTGDILAATDQGRRNPLPIQVKELPEVNGDTIIDFAAGNRVILAMDRSVLHARLAGLGIARPLADAMLHASGIDADLQGPPGQISLDKTALTALGRFFLPLVSFGILNGGSASSYYDQKKNREFSPALFGQLQSTIGEFAAAAANLPKGVGPAYIDPGPPASPGFSFIELKLRGWLLLLRQYQQAAARLPSRLPWDGLEKRLPVFQMVNRNSASEIGAALEAYRQSPLLKDLMAATGADVCSFATGIQDLVAAFTQPGPDGSRTVFMEAYGRPDSPLGLPGGHGQNFKVLEGIYRQLMDSGKRFACLGNIDNLGFLPDPAAIALMILRDRPAAFEFSYKTRMDRKGGVLIATPGGRLTCGDIGQSVSQELVASSEAAGKPLLFNCASGMFDLSWLVPRLADIQARLPIRFTNQDKDAGRYSQGEQTTWEIIGLIDNPLILAVEKRERFLASKFFLDCLLTSGFGQDLAGLPESERELLETGRTLNQGLHGLLRNCYGMELRGGRWQPA